MYISTFLYPSSYTGFYFHLHELTNSVSFCRQVIAAECLAVGCPAALCWGGIQPRVAHAGNAQQTVRTGDGWFPGGSSSTVGICARSSRWPVCSKSSARESQQLASLVSRLSVLRVLVFLLTHALIGSVTMLECVLAFEQGRECREAHG